jgi:hypothetical protein
MLHADCANHWIATLDSPKTFMNAKQLLESTLKNQLASTDDQASKDTYVKKDEQDTLTNSPPRNNPPTINSPKMVFAKLPKPQKQNSLKNIAFLINLLSHSSHLNTLLAKLAKLTTFVQSDSAEKFTEAYKCPSCQSPFIVACTPIPTFTYLFSPLIARLLQKDTPNYYGTEHEASTMMFLACSMILMTLCVSLSSVCSFLVLFESSGKGRAWIYRDVAIGVLIFVHVVHCVTWSSTIKYAKGHFQRRLVHWSDFKTV